MGRLIDLVEQHDKDRVLDILANDPVFFALAEAIREYIWDQHCDGQPDIFIEREIRPLLERTIRHLHRDLAIAVIIHTESALVNRHLEGEPQVVPDSAVAPPSFESPDASYSMQITSVRSSSDTSRPISHSRPLTLEEKKEIWRRRNLRP